MNNCINLNAPMVTLKALKHIFLQRRIHPLYVIKCIQYSILNTYIVFMIHYTQDTTIIPKCIQYFILNACITAISKFHLIYGPI